MQAKASPLGTECLALWAAVTHLGQGQTGEPAQGWGLDGGTSCGRVSGVKKKGRVLIGIRVPSCRLWPAAVGRCPCRLCFQGLCVLSADNTHTHTHTQGLAHAHTGSYVITYTYMYTYKHTQNAHKHTWCVHTRARADTHAHAHTHIHTHIGHSICRGRLRRLAGMESKWPQSGAPLRGYSELWQPARCQQFAKTTPVSTFVVCVCVCVCVCVICV